MPASRITITLPETLVERIDALERNRSRFIVDAVERELERRLRAELRPSLDTPHEEASAVAEEGLSVYRDALPAEPADLVDPAAGVGVEWREGEGWSRWAALDRARSVGSAMAYAHPMKTITVNVSDALYAEFRWAAHAMGRPLSGLIREAMEDYRQTRLAPLHDLRHFEPVSAVRLLRPLATDDDLLGEMLQIEH